MTDLAAETEVREPSVSTILMNFESKFGPYSSMSTPLYQTATFKQVSSKTLFGIFVMFSWFIGKPLCKT